MTITNEFLEEQIAAIKAQVTALETAQLQILSGTIQSYSLDTGQSKQTVTKLNIQVMTNVLNALYNQLATLCARLTGNGVTRVWGSW